MNKNKGFTLIELLVVIAIIGILSSVVLASLSNARDKGKDASVKSQLSSLKAQGELYYSINESYVGVCEATATGNGFKGLIDATVDVSGVDGGAVKYSAINQLGVYNTVTCHERALTSTTPDSWVVEAPLAGSTSAAPSMYCSDSTGVSTVRTAVLAADQYSCTP